MGDSSQKLKTSGSGISSKGKGSSGSGSSSSSATGKPGTSSMSSTAASSGSGSGSGSSSGSFAGGKAASSPQVTEATLKPQATLYGLTEMFKVGVRLELPPQEGIQLFAKFSMGEINCFALTLKKSDDLLLLSDHHWSSSGLGGVGESGGGSQQKWCMKRVPWYNDPLKRITALTFDDEGTLYIGTLDGNILELKALRVLSDQRDSDLNTLYRLVHKIVQIIVWNQDNSKILLCVGSHGNLAIITGTSTPVNVSFTTSIQRVELFQNKTGLTCALVCLETGQNVYTILDDLDLPLPQNESHAKKSIFRKAKDNLMSRLSEDKLGFFGSKRARHDNSASASSTHPPPPNVTITSTSGNAPHQTTHSPVGGGNSTEIPAKYTALTMGSTSSGGGAGGTTLNATPMAASSVRFQTLDDHQCRGVMRKVKGRSQFVRHALNKVDIFDEDFRQVSSVFVPTEISSVFVINRLYYCVDEGEKALRVSLLHNGSLKDITVIPFLPRILSVETMGETSDSSHSVFILAEDGIYELTLRKDPVHTCVAMLLKETSATLLEALCNALNVSKTQACSIAGDIKADEGRFSKSILYYKLAGLTYTQISAKFGSKGLMAAMLFFYELVDQEKTKLHGGFLDKQVMSDLALLGRIEQYLRYGSTRSTREMYRNPANLLRKMILHNIWFSTRRACEWLSEPELLWALKLLSRTRLCYPEVLLGLHKMKEGSLEECLRKNLIWKLMTQDWLALYSAHPKVFVWFREIVLTYLPKVSGVHINRLLHLLLPWRRELQRKIFTEISESAEIINYAQPLDTPKIVLDDYVELFVIVLLECLRRHIPKEMTPLPHFVFKSDARAHQRIEIANHKTNMVATLMLSFTFQKSLSASNSHVLCIRNGRIYSWGENKFGKLGVQTSSTLSLSEEKDREKFQYHSPTPVSISPTLKIQIESVSAGAQHSVALTNVGTLLVWGQNTYGQLGLGKHVKWTGRPVPLHLNDVIFTSVAAGGYHTVAVDHLNRAWTFGWGIHGQLGNGKVECQFYPKPIEMKEKIVAVAAGHSHTAFLTCFGRVLTTGCNHFGQLGLGIPDQKVKVPQMINGLPLGTLIRIVDCGTSSTVMVSTKNRLFYAGLNPASLKSLLNSSRRKERERAQKASSSSNDDSSTTSAIDEEKDFSDPTMIDTSHMAGDITKINCSSTHFAVMSSLGYVYTWGVGKSGQLARPDDDSKSLELIYSADDKMMIASDICCAGDCTFVVEKESGQLHGCGFNSAGQLGKMESEEDQAVMMIRTKKRVVKVRQPSNIHFKLREIPGLPKQQGWEQENSVMVNHKICPPSTVVSQELLEWVIKAFRRNYDASKMIRNCLQAKNYAAASILETMAENHEQALQHNLAGAGGTKTGSLEAINKYLGSIDLTKKPVVEQACRFLTIVIKHWSKHSDTLEASDLEDLLESHREIALWGPCLCCAVKEVIALADESADWIASNLTPVFILRCINESSEYNPDCDFDSHGQGQAGQGSSDSSNFLHQERRSHNHNHSHDNNSSSTMSSTSSSSGASSAGGGGAGAVTSVLNGNVNVPSFGGLCHSSASK